MAHKPIRTKPCPAMDGIWFLIEKARIETEHKTIMDVFSQISILDQAAILKRARLSIKSTVHGFARTVELLHMSYRYACEFLDTIVI